MNQRWIAIFVLFLVATAWGMTFTLVKGILVRIAPEPFMFWRFIIAGLVLLAAALERRRLPRSSIKPGIILGLLVWIGYWAQTHALMAITPSRSALLTGTYVVMVPFCDWIIYRETIAIRAWMGTMLAVVGTAALIGGIDARPQLADVLTLFCAGCFAMHVVLSAKYSGDIPPIALAATQVMFVGIAAAPTMALAARPQWSREVVIAVLFTAIVTTALAFAGLMWGQARVTATEAAVMLAFEPLAAAVTSVVFSGEPLTRNLLVGATLILAAMVLSQLPESPKRDPIPQ
jgi:drug/metabolite transporter (DMT)-like permease